MNNKHIDVQKHATPAKLRSERKTCGTKCKILVSINAPKQRLIYAIYLLFLFITKTKSLYLSYKENYSVVVFSNKKLNNSSN